MTVILLTALLLTTEFPAGWGLFIGVAGFFLGWGYKFYEFNKNNSLEEKKIDTNNLEEKLKEKDDFIQSVQAQLNEYQIVLKECDEHLKKTETQLAILMKQHRILISALKVIIEKQGEGESWADYLEALINEPTD